MHVRSSLRYTSCNLCIVTGTDVYVRSSSQCGEIDE